MAFFANTYNVLSSGYNSFGTEVLYSVSTDVRLGTDLTGLIVSYTDNGVMPSTRALSGKMLGVVSCYQTDSSGYLNRSNVWVETTGMIFVKIDNPDEYSASGGWVVPSYQYPGYGHILNFSTSYNGFTIGRVLSRGRRSNEILINISMTMLGTPDVELSCPSEIYSCDTLSCSSYDTMCPAATVCVVDTSTCAIYDDEENTNNNTNTEQQQQPDLPVVQATTVLSGNKLLLVGSDGSVLETRELGDTLGSNLVAKSKNLIIDKDTNKIIYYSEYLNQVVTIDGTDNNASGFGTIDDALIDNNDVLWVFDSTNSKLWAYSTGGIYMGALDYTPGTSIKTANSINNLAYVSDSKLELFSAANKTKLAEAPFSNATAIAFDSNDNLWVTDETATYKLNVTTDTETNENSYELVKYFEFPEGSNEAILDITIKNDRLYELVTETVTDSTTGDVTYKQEIKVYNTSANVSDSELAVYDLSNFEIHA